MHKLKTHPFAAPRRAEQLRDQAMAEALKRKQEYLGARVPRELKDRVLEKAEKMGIPVSILIRNVLEQAFSGDIPEENQSNKVHSAAELEQRPEKPKILGWKTIELNTDHACDDCGGVMHGGNMAVMAITRNEDDVVIVCQACKAQLQGK